MKVFKIPVDIYRTEVHVLIGVSDEYAKKYYNKFKGDYSDAIVLGDNIEARCICDKSGLVFIRLKDNPPNSVVVHEFLHCVFYVLSNRGLLLSNESEEAYTYLLGYLIQEFEYKLNRDAR